jgi:hypothetical protein
MLNFNNTKKIYPKWAMGYRQEAKGENQYKEFY